MPTREELLDAAERVVRRAGVTGATTREIAKEAGCSEGTLYNHFDDKHRLIVEVLMERNPTFMTLIADLPERAGASSVRAHLLELGMEAIEFYRDLAPLIGATISNPVLRAEHQERLRRSDRGPQLPLRALASYLEAEQRLGRVRRRVDTDAAAALFLGGCFQYAFLSLAVPPDHLPGDPSAYLKGAVRALLTGLNPEETDA